MSEQSSFQRVAQDVIDLCELQFQLLSVDSQAARRLLLRGVAKLVVAVPLLGSAITVLCLGVGYLIAERTALSVAGSLIVVSVAVILFASSLAVIALVGFRRAAAAMAETKSEFTENLKWLKATLLSPSTSPRNQIRRESFPDHSPSEFHTDSQPHFQSRPVSQPR
ncbi:phage holin family protein [Stieleria varia]|uniref:Phage holin family protein n=1 Tax=Stieleria varia TaxID=2528005 RepID=A0A5C6B8L9_9BACT|nr:phage holin family protein [Stieleria varia]TWU08433.1 hypothetical protein Pla52n_10160 [Stieleria varia]